MGRVNMCVYVWHPEVYDSTAEILVTLYMEFVQNIKETFNWKILDVCTLDANMHIRG